MMAFDFNISDRNEEYSMRSHSSELHCAVWEYAAWLRDICNYGNPSEITAEKCRAKFHEFLTERNITI